MMKPQYKSEVILKSKKVTQSMCLLSIPVIVSNLFKMVNELVDMYFVSNLAVDKQTINLYITSLTVAYPVITIFETLIIALGVVALTMISQSVGENDNYKVTQYRKLFLKIGYYLGIILNLLLFGVSLFLVYASNNKMLYNVGIYVMIRSFEMVGLVYLYQFQASHHAYGDTISPMIVCFISTLINIILTCILTPYFNLVGAGVATVFSVYVSFFICLLFNHRNKTNMEEEPTTRESNIPKLRDIISLLISSSGAGIMTAGGFIVVNRMIMSLGDNVMTSIATSSRIYNVLSIPFLAIEVVLTAFISQNIGAKNYERVKKSILSAFDIVIVVSLFVIGIGFLFNDNMHKVFIKNNHEVMLLCNYYFKHLLWTTFIMGLYHIIMGLLHGIKKLKLCFLLSVIRLWVLRIPIMMALIYKQNLGIEGVVISIYASNIGCVIVGLCCLLFYFSKNVVLKKYKEKV